VLLVEDDAAARSGYAEFLAESGFRVVALGAASVALDHLANEVPDIVLTDIALPDLNGFELTRALKRDPRLAAITVIGLTGHWSSQATRGARDAGMAALLLKPVAPAHLLAEVNRVLAQR
jgi:CheY-like chemotaxis protein